MKVMKNENLIEDSVDSFLNQNTHESFLCENKNLRFNACCFSSLLFLLRECVFSVLHVRRRKSLFIRRNCSLKPKFIEEGPGEKQKAFKLLRIAQNVLAGCDGFLLSTRQEFCLKRRPWTMTQKNWSRHRVKASNCSGAHRLSINQSSSQFVLCFFYSRIRWKGLREVSFPI